jgi:23S rRNA (guanosine2251-2'-O)-methyltransferase
MSGRERPSQPRGGRSRRPVTAAPEPSESGLLYGRNPIHEALRAGRRPVHQVWATAAAAREPWLAGAPVQLAEGSEIAERTGTDAHQGMCAEAGPYPYVDEATLLAGDPLPSAPRLIVALDEVQDPQNLGAIARSAECAGASGLVIPRHRSAEVTPAVGKASAGAVEHLPIARVRNLADFLMQAQKTGFWAYGADADGVPHTEPDYGDRVVLVLGAEGKGLRPRVREACDQLVAIPLRGRMESLNVSAAAAVLLYEISPATG